MLVEIQTATTTLIRFSAVINNTSYLWMHCKIVKSLLYSFAYSIAKCPRIQILFNCKLNLKEINSIVRGRSFGPSFPVRRFRQIFRQQSVKSRIGHRELSKSAAAVSAKTVQPMRETPLHPLSHSVFLFSLMYLSIS